MPLDPQDWDLGIQDRDQFTVASLVITVIAVTVGLAFLGSMIALVVVGS